MKTVGQAFAAVNASLDRSEFEDSKAYLAISRDRLATTISFWRDRKKDDAIKLLRETLTKLDDLDAALSAEKVDPRVVAAAAKQVGFLLRGVPRAVPRSGSGQQGLPFQAGSDRITVRALVLALPVRQGCGRHVLKKNQGRFCGLCALCGLRRWCYSSPSAQRMPPVMCARNTGSLRPDVGAVAERGVEHSSLAEASAPTPAGSRRLSTTSGRLLMSVRSVSMLRSTWTRSREKPIGILKLPGLLTFSVGRLAFHGSLAKW